MEITFELSDADLEYFWEVMLKAKEKSGDLDQAARSVELELQRAFGVGHQRVLVLEVRQEAHAIVGTGLTRGCGESSFCPDHPVTRGQMAAFLFRVFGGGADIGESGFVDVGSESPFVAEIAWMADTGISNGCDADRFCPDEPLTRGQMASFL